MSRAPDPPELRTHPSLADVELVFDALAHATRRHIVLLLSTRGELPSGYLAKRLAHSWPTTTRHLHVLETAGIVTVRREGRGSFYSVDRDRLRRIVGSWLALLEPPTPTEQYRSTGPTSTKGKRS